MVSVSKYLKDTEDTAPRVSVSQIHFKSIFPNPGVLSQYNFLSYDATVSLKSTEACPPLHEPAGPYLSTFMKVESTRVV